jgi:hypothetical protein
VTIAVFPERPYPPTDPRLNVVLSHVPALVRQLAGDFNAQPWADLSWMIQSPHSSMVGKGTWSTLLPKKGDGVATTEWISMLAILSDDLAVG